MTTIGAGDNVMIPFCCPDYTAGGVEWDPEGWLFAPTAGVYAIDSIITYADSSAPAIAFVDGGIRASIVVRNASLSPAFFPAFSWCFVNHGSIALPCQFPLEAGDSVGVSLFNQSAAPVFVYDESFCAMTQVAPHVPVNVCVTGSG